MFILRLIAVMCLIFAAIAAGAEFVELWRTHHWHAITAGQLWLNLHPSSLIDTHAFIQRYVYAGLWDPVMIWALRQPAWLVAGVPGLVFLWLDLGMTLGVPRQHRRRFRTS